MYGLLEKQFRKYVDQATKTKGDTGEMLLSLLERRLDNIIFRLGFAPTRPAARQLVSHRHILINGKKVNIPSFQVVPGQTITLSKTAMDIPHIKTLIVNEEYQIPAWLERKAAAGRMVRTPKREDVPEPISVRDIIEFYSR